MQGCSPSTPLGGLAGQILPLGTDVKQGHRLVSVTVSGAGQIPELSSPNILAPHT